MNTTGRKPHKAVSHTDSHESCALLLSGCTNYASHAKMPRHERRGKVVLEEVAKMARLTESVNPDVKPAPDNIKEKHFYRKHGANAYYGQN